MESGAGRMPWLSTFRGGYRPPQVLRGGLAVLHDRVPPEVHGLREAGVHALERGPAALVPDALRAHGLGPPRVHDDEVRVAADLDQPLWEPEDLRGTVGHRSHEPLERQGARLHLPEEERERGRDAGDARRDLVERSLLLLL